MTNGQKFWQFEWFCPWGRKCRIGAQEQLWMHREHGWARISGRNSNTQLFMSSIMIWYLVDFTEKHEHWKSDFLIENDFL